MNMADALRELSEPWERGDKIKAAIARASRASGISYWRAFDIWYGKARQVRDFEREQVAAALAEKKRLETRNELHELRTRLTRLESLLAQTDPDFHRESLDQVRDQIRTMGGARGPLDRAVAQATKGAR